MVSRRQIASFMFVLVPLILLSNRVIGADTVDPGKKNAAAVSGRFIVKGGSMAGGQVLFFDASTGPMPDFSKYTRLPDLFSKIDGEGKFEAEIPSGAYYIAAIKRLSGERLGTPQEGDFRFLDRDENGSPKKHMLKPGQRLDLGTREASLFTKKDLPEKSNTRIEGIITDIAGNPVEGVMVFAFTTARNDRRPLFVSDKSGKDGVYALRVVEGTYNLKARDVYGGGQPRVNSLIGMYGEKEPVPVFIKNKETIKGINIKVFAVQPRNVQQAPGGNQVLPSP